MSIFTTKKESLSNSRHQSVINRLISKIQDIYYDICYWFSNKCTICSNLIEYREIVCGISESDNLSIIKMIDFQVKLLKERIIKETIGSLPESHINGNVELYEKLERLSILLNNFIEDNFYDRFGGDNLSFDCDFLPNKEGGFDFIDNTTDEQNEINDKIQYDIDTNTEKEWNEMIELFSDVMAKMLKYR